MRRPPLHAWLASALIALPVLSTAGCADNDSSLFIYGVLVPDEADCSFSFDTGAPRYGRGLMDKLFTDEYEATLLVGNQLTAQSDSDQLRTETSRVQLEGAEVRLTTVDGATVVHFSTAVAGFTDVGSGTAPGLGGGTVTLIPPSANVQPGNEYLAEVRMFGETLGGTDVETGAFVYPIEVCEGCLLSFNEQDELAGACTQKSIDASEGRCTPGTDEKTNCILCAGRPGCPA